MASTCNLTCIFLGWCLDLYGTDGYIIRPMLQAYLWCPDGDYTWGYSRNDFISSMFLSSYCVIVQVRVVLKRIVVGDWHYDNLSRSHLQSQLNSVCQSQMLHPHQQQFFSELPPPGRSHNTNYRYSWGSNHLLSKFLLFNNSWVVILRF